MPRRQPGTEQCRHPGTAGPRAQGGQAGLTLSSCRGCHASRLGLPAPKAGRVTLAPGLCGAALSPGSVSLPGVTRRAFPAPRWEVPSGRCPFSRKGKSEITSNWATYVASRNSVRSKAPKPQASEAAGRHLPTPSAPSPASHLQEDERLRGPVRSLQDGSAARPAAGASTVTRRAGGQAR